MAHETCNLERCVGCPQPNNGKGTCESCPFVEDGDSVEQPTFADKQNGVLRRLGLEETNKKRRGK